MLKKSKYTNKKIAFPEKIDLSIKCSPIVDQEELGSCTSNALVSGLREYILINHDNKPFVKLSRLFVYWLERHFQGTVEDDSGASLKNGLDILCIYGTCTEKIDPYDITKFTEKPSDEEMQEALQYRIDGYKQIHSIYDIKKALYNNNIVVFSMPIFTSCKTSEVKRTGIIPIPKSNEIKIGEHAMCIVGYDDNFNGGSFIIRNSWGVQWGKQGYGYIQYEMINYFIDIWTVLYDKKHLRDYLHVIHNFFHFLKNKFCIILKSKLKNKE